MREIHFLLDNKYLNKKGKKWAECFLEDKDKNL